MSLRWGSVGVDAPCQPPRSAVGCLVAAWSWGQGTTGGGQVSYSPYRMFARQMFDQPEVLTGTKQG